MPHPDYTKSHLWSIIKIIMIWGSHSGAAASGMWCCIAGQAVCDVSDSSTFCIRLKQPKKTVGSKHHKWLAQWHYHTAQMNCIFKTNLTQNFKTADYQLNTAPNIIIFILNKNQLNSVRITGPVQCLIHLTHPTRCCTIISKPSKEKFQFIPHTFTIIFAFSYFSPTFRHSLRTKTRMSKCTTYLCAPHVYQPICNLESATTLFVEVLRNSVKEFFTNTIKQAWVLQWAAQWPSHFP